MRHIFLVFCLLISLSNTAFSAVLVFSPNGQYTTKADIAAAAAASDAAGKKVVITSPYNITSNTTWPNDRTLEIANGGLVTVSSGVTFTINGPFKAGPYQCFAGPGSVTFGPDYIFPVQPEMFGSGDDAFAKAAAASLNVVARGAYTASTITLRSGHNIDATNATITSKDALNTHLVTASGISNASIVGGTWDGNKANQTSNGSIMYFTGCDRVTLRDVITQNGYGGEETDTDVTNGTSLAGVTIHNSTNFDVVNMTATGSRRSGLLFIEGSKHTVTGGKFSGNGYGGIVTSNSADVTLVGAKAYNNGVGNTASGISLNGLRNKAIGCISDTATSSAINVGHGTNTKLNASQSEVIGCTATGGVSGGITVLGGTTQTQTGVILSDNITYSNAVGISISTYCDKTKVRGNNSYSNTTYGIRNEGNNGLFAHNTVTGNTTYGVFQNGSTVSGNEFYENVINSNPGNFVNNGIGTIVNRVMKHYVNSVGHTGTTDETDITGESVTVLANKLLTKSGIRVTAWGSKTGSAGNKTIKLYFGATAVTAIGPTNDTNSWSIDTTIYNNNSTSSQKIVAKSYNASTLSQVITTSAIDTTADVLVKLTGTLANSADSITVQGFRVEYLPE